MSVYFGFINHLLNGSAQVGNNGRIKLHRVGRASTASICRQDVYDPQYWSDHVFDSQGARQDRLAGDCHRWDVQTAMRRIASMIAALVPQRTPRPAPTPPTTSFIAAQEISRCERANRLVGTRRLQAGPSAASSGGSSVTTTSA